MNDYAQTHVTESGETTPTYPLRIRFWYLIHNAAERLWHWVWRTRLRPFYETKWSEFERHQTPTYRHIATAPAADEPKQVEIMPGVFVESPVKGSGIVESKIYVCGGPTE